MTITPSQRLCDTLDVVIANGASLSPAYNLGGHVLTGVYMSAGWTAASLTFQASHDGATYYNVYTSAGETSIATAAGVYVAMTGDDFFGVNFIKVRSGTAGTPVAQAAERTLTLMCGVPTPAH